jgi:SAM-dependent methyltransferase
MTQDCLLDKYKGASQRRFAGEEYKGLAIHARPGLHEHVALLIRRHVRASCNVTELAAGSGAMCLRLTEMGYRVTAVDAVEENFVLRDSVPFRQLDLNGDFASELPVADAVVAVEIIEHLENPRHFLRQVHQLLAPGGRALITTPNILNPVSRAIYLREGRYQWFMEQHYASEGHITPVPHWLLLDAAREAGLEVIELGSYGDPFPAVANWPSARWLAVIAARLMRTGILGGEILIAVLGRKN